MHHSLGRAFFNFGPDEGKQNVRGSTMYVSNFVAIQQAEVEIFHLKSQMSS